MISLRVVHILSDLSVSSAASGVINIMRWQQSQGQETLLLAGTGERLADAVTDGLDVQLLDKYALRLQKRALEAVCQRLLAWGVDVLHAHRVDCLPLAMKLAEQLDLPLIVNIQRSIPVEHAVALRESRVAWVQVPNQALRAHCINELGIERDRVVVLPYALTLDRIKPWQRQAARKIEVLGAIGNFDDLHGFEQICKMMVQMHADGIAMKAMFLGSGDGQHKLLRLIRNLHLQDHISLICGSPQIGRFLSIMDAFIYPSRNDAMSVVLMKAMACGVPVIAPAFDGIPELIHHDKTGFLVPELSKGALLSQMVTVLRDAEHSHVVAKEGQAMVEACYSTDAIGNLYDELYENAVRGERHSTATRAVSTAFIRRTETAMSS